METLIDPSGDQIFERGGVVAAGSVRSFFDLNDISMQRKSSKIESTHLFKHILGVIGIHFCKFSMDPRNSLRQCNVAMLQAILSVS
jgi:hypothetical protein